MARRLWPASRRWRGIAIAAASVLIIILIVVISSLDRRPSLESMGILPPLPVSMPVLTGDEWHAQATDGEGFSQAAENGKFILLLEPGTSQIIVRDKAGGHQWRSNPSKVQLEQETVQGALLANLQSPFILEYVTGSQTRRNVKNTVDPDVSISYTLMEQEGIQATYTYNQLQLSIVIQYVLTEGGLEARIPSEGIVEWGDSKVFAINPLPFFGSVSAGEQEPGYLFVPDGPGGLIHFNRNRPANVRSYEFPIYGDDAASLKSAMMREQISYPVFGLKRSEQAYAAIVKEGQYSASIKAYLPGSISSMHTVSANFSYRQEFGRRVSGITKEVVITVQKERNKHDRSVEYRLLSGEQADYVGMAHSYRSYLEERGQLDGPLAKVDDVPIQLSIIGGGLKPKFGGTQYEKATTFKQAEELVNDLLQNGVSNMTILYQGWQHGGVMGTDQRFPVASAIGGDEGAKRFIDKMHEKDVKVYFQDFMASRNSKATTFDMKKNGIRTLDTTIWQSEWGGPMGYTQFIVNPMDDIREQKKAIDKMKALGVDGVHYLIGPGNVLYSDYNPSAPLTQKETAYYYEQLLDYTREKLGAVSVFRGFDHVLEHVDFIQELPFDTNYDIIIDETVPFYPMVVHGAIPYSAAAGNLRNIYDVERLKAIEYGAIPFFTLTYSQSRVLQATDYDAVFSSEYALWKDRLVEEYEAFNQLSGIYHQRMVDHEKLAEGVYVTTYEDGTAVKVDYNAMQFQVMGGE